MRLKDVVEVLANYDFIRVIFPQNEVADNDDSVVIGYCDHEKHVVYIDRNISLQRLREVIIHELVHADLHIRGMKDDEKTVRRKSRKLYERIYAADKSS